MQKRIAEVNHSQANIQQTSSQQAETLRDAMEFQQAALSESLNDQVRYAEALSEEVGKTISMFTLVNVLFLPFGFFSQLRPLALVISYRTVI
jgi:hypothetical protein